jgi:uncharacterized membrane protein YsdA (DUF1294 family)
VGGVYAGASVVAFAMYAADKSASKKNAWRISESALHAIGLVGGWPGALAAQQLLRHKTSKPSFRVAFWGTVVLNVAAFVFFASPLVDRVAPGLR